MNRCEILAAYIRSHPTFVIVASVDRYHHMGAMLSDAVLQRGIDYESVVRPRIAQILSAFPEATTTTAFARILAAKGAPSVLQWANGQKPQTLVALVKLLLEEKIETEDELRLWLQKHENVVRLKQIKGIKDKTADYLKILVGAQTVAVDMHLFAFLAEAGLPAHDYAEAHRIITGAADLLGVEAARLDHSIWRHMSARSSRKRAPVCPVLVG